MPDAKSYSQHSSHRDELRRLVRRPRRSAQTPARHSGRTSVEVKRSHLQVPDAGTLKIMRAALTRQSSRRAWAEPSTILITGATGGIGAALARSYARPRSSCCAANTYSIYDMFGRQLFVAFTAKF
jgi:FlaA1/EpsC-like NDP-sugar epimerase